MLQTRVRPPLLLLAGAVLSATLSGCSGPLNNEVSIGQAWLPSTLDARDDEIPAAIDSRPPVPPSITSLSRADWQRSTFLVPNDRPAHQPLYTDNWYFTDYRGVPRRRIGAYPTLESSLAMPSRNDIEAQVWEALVAPVASGAEVLLFPIRAVPARPWQRTRTGFEPYERAPRPQRELPEPARPVAAPPEPAVEPAEPAPGIEPAGETP